MRILIDMQSMQSGSSKGGIGRYSLSLLEAMVKNNTKHEISILLNADLSLEHLGKLQRLIPNSRIYKFYKDGDTREIFDQNSFRGESSKLAKEYVVSLINPDIFFIMSLMEGLYESVITSVGELYPSKRTAVVLYDLIPLVEKEKYLSSLVVHNHYMGKLFYMIQSGILLSISQFSKDEAVSLIKTPPEQIVNISSAIDDKFKKIDIPLDKKTEILTRYGIRDKFLMFTGSFDIRKNQERLIKSFAALDKKLRKDYQLVIIGTGAPQVLEHLQSVVKSEKLHKNNEVLFLGFVNDDDLLSLYNLASLFVFPTLREGFGLPALEAMSCGIPTIGSNTTSIPEVINKKEALFSPLSIEQISQKLEEVLSNKEFSEELIEHGLKQAENFSWDLSAQKTIQALEDQFNKIGSRKLEPESIIYNKLIKKVSKIPNLDLMTDNDLKSVSNMIAKNYEENRRNIGVISTWNTRCGIASYIKYLSPSFLKNAIILAPYITKEELVVDDENFVLRCWNMFNDELEELYKNIEYLELDTVFIQFNYGFFNFHEFNRFIQKLSNKVIKIFITLHSTQDKPKQEEKKLSDISLSLKSFNNIFIHTEQDILNLNNIGVKDNIQLVNQGIIDIYPVEEIKEQKEFTIATYGFFLENKGLIDFIKVFKKLIDKGYDLKLKMYNAKYSDAASNDLINQATLLIKEYSLEEYIQMDIIYLSDIVTIQNLSKVDLVVFPYKNTGESSSAAVRMAIAAGAKIAVTPQGIFDEVKDFSFIFKDDTIEGMTEGMEYTIEQIKKDDEIINNMKNKMIQFRKENSYSKLSHKIMDFIK